MTALVPTLIPLAGGSAMAHSTDGRARCEGQDVLFREARSEASVTWPGAQLACTQR
jgi:hypothetical protein